MLDEVTEQGIVFGGSGNLAHIGKLTRSLIASYAFPAVGERMGWHRLTLVTEGIFTRPPIFGKW